MIVVTGGTGALGGAVVRELLRRVPAERLGVSVRDPGRADALAARGVRVRRGDFADPATLADAFEGASSVLITSIDALGPDAVAQHVAAARAAADAGAGRVFYTAHQNSLADSAFAAASDHAATEAGIAEIGIPWTSLRNGFYAHTVGLLTRGAAETGEIALPADGPVSWTAREDLAAGAAALLAADVTGAPTFDGPTPALTAAQAVTFDDVAETVSTASGNTVRRIVIDDDDWVERMVGAGMPRAAVELMLGLFVAARRGDFATVDPTLGELIGRPPRTVGDVLAAA
ncbi:NmrA family NAD(P)-binding protein [Tsukamurella soli]|uniref:NAD(P)H-binding protein n=1 Tax=Tsukamurella soli TaxID=644556 RepID=A0ABP8K838_9ACTN